MSNSRKKLTSQINRTVQLIDYHYAQAQMHKTSLKEYKLNHRLLSVLIITIPAFIVGWSMGSKRTVGSIAKRVAEMGTLAASTHLKKHLMSFL